MKAIHRFIGIAIAVTAIAGFVGLALGAAPAYAQSGHFVTGEVQKGGGRSPAPFRARGAASAVLLTSAARTPPTRIGERGAVTLLCSADQRHAVSRDRLGTLG
jgi:hypothetical protein